MAYAYQTFSSGQVFTGAQAQQCEVNIRDHKHGLNSVQNIGLTWIVGSLNAARGINNADTSFNYECYGSFDLDFAPAAQLGSLFAVTFVNCGSERIGLKAAAGEYIGTSSAFALTPGCAISIYGRDSSPLGMFGQTVGQFLLGDIRITGSMQNIDFDGIYPGEFDLYELKLTDPLIGGTTTTLNAELSVDSGTTFVQTAYANANGVGSAFMAFSNQTAITSNMALNQRMIFRNTIVTTGQNFFAVCLFQERSGAGTGPRNYTHDHVCAIGSLLGGVTNAIRIVPGNGAAYFQAGRAQLFGWRGLT